MQHGYCALLAVLLSACGYVGDPLPPALHIPGRVTDLTAVQRGGRIEIRFTAPAQTTEDLVMRNFESMDLRIGPVPKEFTFETWAATAKPLDASVPEPGKPVTVAVSASEWRDREVLIAVRFTSTRGRRSEWSNSVLLTPRAPLRPPPLSAELRPEGVRISWPAGQVRLYREEELIATVTAGPYVDRAVEAGKTYSYRAQAVEGPVESALSAPVSITVQDKFAPGPPTGVTAVVGIESIELAWEPNPEPDLSGYRVYRALGSGEFAVLAARVEPPAFSDRMAAASGVHRYRVTAIDRSGNESAPSAVVEAIR